MTPKGLGTACIVVGIVMLCLSRVVGPYQVDFHNRYWGTALTDRARRWSTWSYYLGSAVIILFGTALVLFG